RSKWKGDGMKRPKPSVSPRGPKNTRSGRAALINAPVVMGTGLIALDIILGVNPSLSPIVATGGTCGNVLAILSFLGWNAFPVGRLGRDLASEIVRRDLTSSQVSLELASQEPVASTPIIVQR